MKVSRGDRRGRRCRTAPLFAAIGPLFAARALAQTDFATQTGAIGNWNTPANWTHTVPAAFATFPNNGNGGLFYNCFVSSGQAALTSDITINQLALSGGTVSGTNTLNTLQLFSWSGGTLSGAGTNVAINVLVISGSSFKTLSSGRHLINAGSGTWSGTGHIIMDTSSVFRNVATFDIQTDAGFLGGTLENIGILRKTAGAASTTITGTLVNNNGTVTVNSGELVLAGDSGDYSGRFNGTSAGGLRISGGNHNFAAGAELMVSNFNMFGGNATSAGSWTVGSYSQTGGAMDFTAAPAVTTNYNVSGGTLAFAVNSTLGPLNLSGGTLQGAGNLLLKNGGDWSGGDITGSGTVTAQLAFNLSGTSIKRILGPRTLLHQGNSSWTGGVVSNSFSSHFINLGTFTSNAGFGATWLGGHFENQGLLIQSGTVTGNFNVASFINSGTVRVDGVAMLLAATTGTHSGRISGAGKFIFNNGNHVFTDSAQVDVGTLELTGGTVTARGNWQPGTTRVSNGATLVFQQGNCMFQRRIGSDLVRLAPSMIRG